MENRKQDKGFLAAYDAYADALFRYCYFKTSDKELAADLVQQIYLRAWTYLQSGQTINEFRPFLYKLANNLVIDWYRRKKSESLDKLHDSGFDPTYTGTNAEVSSELNLALRYLQKLKEEDRTLIVWRYVDDLSPREIANILKLKENIVSVRLHRAMDRLRKWIKN